MDLFEMAMRPILLIAIAGIFCTGFLIGYLMRAMFSWRRRRHHGRQFPVRDSDGLPDLFNLQKSAAHYTAELDATSLASTPDAPSLAADEYPRHSGVGIRKRPPAANSN